jgi:hypothetical protein
LVRGTKWTWGLPSFSSIVAYSLRRSVLLATQVDVPARQTVLDLAVGARVLLEHDGEDVVVREDAGGFRSGGRTPDYRDRVLFWLGHGPAS